MARTRNLGIFRLREHVRQSLWFVPTLCVILAAAAAIALVALDARENFLDGSDIGFGGGPDGARELVSAIAGSMVAFIGTVFSITVLVMQLASSQFSPRALRSFLRDRRSQFPLGIFMATLVYSLVVLWSIRTDGDGREGFVPHLAITGAYVMVLASLATFVFFIHHVSQSIRVANVVHRIGAESLAVLAQRYPHPWSFEAQVTAPAEMCGVGHAVPSAAHGVVLAIDVAPLVARARELGGRVEVAPYVGDFVATGSTLGWWDGDPAAVDELDLERYVTLGRERTMEQDIGFGSRQLVDVAEKALSPGVNDPTTAVQALDQLHNVMRQLGTRAFPHELHHDEDGGARLITHEHDWADMLHLAFDEIRVYGASSIQVRARLRAVLDDLLASVPDARRGEVQAQLELLDRAS